MAGYIPHNILDEIRAKADIVDVVSEYLPLKKSGRNFKAPCPFHSEKTPSFMVSPAKQIYHCFGCGEGGNVFTFVMKKESLDFSDAVKKIAQKVGVKIPQTIKVDKNKQSLINQVYTINETALKFYNICLEKADEARKAKDYLYGRGFKEMTIAKFKLGYAPKKWDAFYNYLKQKGFSQDLALKAGLISRKQTGGFCDRFRDRVMFPIFNLYNKVIGFGARTLEEGKMPKYLNTQETPVFNKGRNLYALNLAKSHILDKEKVIIVEGYTDCISCHENGIEETVASLGTALTVEQIRALKRYTKNIILIFDPDKAGELATLRGLDLLISEDITPKIVVLPEGLDPDKYLEKFGAPAFKKLIKEAINLFDYKIKLLFSKYKAKTPEGKMNITAEFLPTLNLINNAVLKSSYVKKLAEELSINERDVLDELSKHKTFDYDYQESVVKGSTSAGENRIDMAEKILITLMLENNDVIKKIKAQLKPEDFFSYTARKIVDSLFELAENKKEISPAILIDALDNEKISRFISSISIDLPEIKDIDKNITDCIKNIKERNIKKKLKVLQSELKTAQEKDIKSKVTQLTAECSRLLNQHKELIASIK